MKLSLVCTALTFILASLASLASADDSRPNILFIFSDDHAPAPAASRAAYLDALNPAQREALALGVMQKVAQRFQTGGQPWSVGDLARSLKVAKAEVWSVVDDLGEVGMVAELSRDGRVMPGRNLDNVLVCQVLGAVRGSLDQGRGAGIDQEDPALVELMSKVIAAEEKALGQQRLMDLVGSAEPPPAASCTAPAERE